MTRRDDWRDEEVAASYEARRFTTPLQLEKHARDVALVLALLRRAPGKRVLDFPTGTGRLLPALVGHGYSVVGADVALEMMRAGRETRGEVAPVVQAEASRLPFRDGAFDAVVSLRFLFHLTAEERAHCLAELARVARGGVVIGQVRYRLTAKHAGRWLRSRVGLTRKYRESVGSGELRRELSRAGIELTIVRRVSWLFSDKAFFLGSASHPMREVETVASRASSLGALV